MTGARIGSSLVWCGVTLLVYLVATRVHLSARRHPLVNTVPVAVAILAPLLLGSHTPYAEYREAVRPISLVLGPATVALALPLYRSLGTLRAAARPVAIGVAVGAGTAATVAVLVGRMLGASSVTVRSLAPKSVTTPIAIEVAARIGGDASLASVFVLLTGTLGAMSVPTLFELLRIDDRRARGLAIGVAAHGLGTARAIALGATEGGFAAVGMCLSGLFTPVFVPLLMALLG